MFLLNHSYAPRKYAHRKTRRYQGKQNQKIAEKYNLVEQQIFGGVHVQTQLIIMPANTASNKAKLCKKQIEQAIAIELLFQQSSVSNRLLFNKQQQQRRCCHIYPPHTHTHSLIEKLQMLHDIQFSTVHPSLSFHRLILNFSVYPAVVVFVESSLATMDL